MEKFEREDRYLIIKRKDLAEAAKTLNDDHLKSFNIVLSHIDSVRRKRGVDQIKAVVIENDWPEYEQVWKAIEKRFIMGL